MNLLTEEQTHHLRTSISQPLPCCTGMMQVPQEDLVIYYGKDELSARRIDLLHASDESLERLVAACDPATFGLNHESVHDESYRKARKLGSKAFMPTLDLTSLGLINIVCDSLLRGTDYKTVRAQLYNLNVYEKDSFFMPHVDTPRSVTMFGSLVIFYPTRHEGGALVMRQGDKEWTFDSATVLSDGAESRIGYAAFYSDVEHEVKMVTAGHRVTITYNLYYEVPSELPVLSPHSSMFKATLQSLLLDEAFLPNGGSLAFGLQHGYALPSESDVPLDSVLKYFKGSDAEILHVAKELSLNTSLWTLVDNDGSQYLCKKHRDFTRHSFYSEDWSFKKWLRNFAKNVNRLKKHGGLKVQWITESSEANVDKQPYATYGNEPSLDFAYSSICLLIQIGEPGSRSECQNSLGEDDEYDED